MNLENSPDKFKKATRLYLGKTTCSECGKAFIVSEYELSMPGTKDLESVYCPYCNTYNGEVFINGLARSSKIDE